MFSGGITQTKSAADVSFEDLGVEPPLLEALAAIEFHSPTQIQARAIPVALAGSDLIGLAQTGSGKTGAFGIPMAQRFLDGGGLRGLVLCPTREIALQNEAFLTAVGRSRALRTVAVIGGVGYGPQLRELRRRPDIVVATPGRLLDLHERGEVSFEDVEIFVMDEADRMFDMGFLPQIRRVLERLPHRRQTMLFSATMPPEIERLATRFMDDPVRLDVLPEGRVAEGIDHRLYLVEEEDKKRCLLALVDEEPGAMLVFVERKVDADWACRQIELKGHPVTRIHGDRTQRQRVSALSGIRQGEHRILVATDVAARGIDLPIIEHIVNFDLPDTEEVYIHRAGRTARGDAGGTVSSIATWKDLAMIHRIESALGHPLPRCEAEGIEPYSERKKTIKGRERIKRRFR